MINFGHGSHIEARIYRHCDGYPKGVLPDLAAFFSDVERQTNGDTRFDDPSYLAAKFVVWQANRNAHGGPMLDFRSVGICAKEMGGVEYRYFIDCTDRNTRPTVRHEEA